MGCVYMRQTWPRFNVFAAVSGQRWYGMKKKRVLQVLGMVPIFRPFTRNVSAYILETGAKMAPHLLGNDVNSKYNLPHHINPSETK